MINRCVFRVLAVVAAAGCLVCAEVYGQGEAPEEYEDLPVMSRGELRFFVDTAGFRGPEGQTRQEIYALLDANQLQFIPEKDYFVAQIDMTAELADSSNQTVKKEVWTRNVSLNNLDELQEASAPFREIIGFDVPPGDYRLRFSIEDIYGDRRGTAEKIIRVQPFESTGLTSSNILFASELASSTKQGRFSKYGWQVIPNTTRSYLAGRPLHFYVELYNFAMNGEKKDQSFILGYSLVDTSGVAVKSYPARRFAKPGESCVKVDSVDTDGVPSGTYYLQVEVFDRGSRQHSRSRRMVFLAGSGNQEEELSESQQDQLRYYQDIRYVADNKDLKIYNSLESQDSKMKFLRAFWKQLDPTPETPMNERLIEHMRRMQHAENHFSGNARERGSETDKGRVYIKYGPPDDVEYNTAAAGQKPYEVWAYERQGRYEFVFRDRSGLGIYELVHSTYPGELYNPGWESEF